MKRALSCLLGFVLLAPSLPVNAADTLATEAEAYVQQTGIMTADGNGDFRANERVTRYDVLNVVLSQVYTLDDPEECYSKIAASLPPTFTLLFRDVPADSAYAKKICIGMVAGLVGGKQGGMFGPWENVTTAEASKILARAYGLYEIGCTEPQGAPWYQTYMWVLRKHGALPASADSSSHLLTRGELAQMLYGLRDLQISLQDHRADAVKIVQQVNQRPVGSQRAESTVTQITQKEPTIRGVPLSKFLQQGIATNSRL